MAVDTGDIVNLKVDVGVLKEQFTTITNLCSKMDKVIDKLMENQEKTTNQIYIDMDRRQESLNTDIRDLHSRITTISREMTDKVELTEHRIMEEIRSLRNEINEHNKKEDSELKKILQWKWMIAGGMLVITWLISHVKIDILSKLFN